MLAVAEHYQHFGGVSPINGQNRALIGALETELKTNGVQLPIYFGNRNWHPLLPETLAQMKRDGVQRALAFFTSAFSSYSGCRQYRENIAVAQEVVAASTQDVGESAPVIEKLRVFFNHPGFIEPMIERTRDALSKVPVERREAAALLFSAHSIPLSMALNCRYEEQLREASRLIAEGVNHPEHRLVYQSRSGPATQPWLEPDVGDVVKELAAGGQVRDVVVVPVGFISDHMEVLYDLDDEAKGIAKGLGLNLVRAGTVGTHPRFVTMIRELIEERISGRERLALGTLGPSHDVCPADCCRYEPRRPL